jgi:non-specific serine/threonine protein kinase
MLAEALERYVSVDNRRGIADCLSDIASIAGERGQPEVCVKLLAAAKKLRGTIGLPERQDEFPDLAAVHDRAEQALGVTATRRAEGAGSTMPLAVATGLALQVVCRSGQGAGESPLTPRQRQIAGLVAAGQTNRRIARTLGIAEKTVEVHISNMMERLGAHSRAEVAAHAVSAFPQQQ